MVKSPKAGGVTRLQPFSEDMFVCRAGAADDDASGIAT